MAERKQVQTLLFEKPSQAADWARFLGFKPADKKRNYYFSKEKNIYLINAVGHLFGLAGPEHYVPELSKPWQLKHLPVFPKKFELNLSDDKKVIFNTIKTVLGKTDVLYIATDPDNEGELIARDIIRFANYSGHLKRVLFSATDNGSLKKAWDNPVSEETTRFMAKEADLRRRLDWMVGMNLTMAMTTLLRKNNEIKKGAFSVGRVITAASLIVYQNTMARKNFKPQTFYNVKLKCMKNSGDEFFVILDVPGEYLDKQSGRLLSSKVATSFANQLKGVEFKADTVEVKRKKISPPLPFDLSKLQVAVDRFDIGAKETLTLLQTLYDQPLSAVTYPRTDKRHLPESMLDDVKVIVNHLNSLSQIKKLDLDLDKKPKAFNDKKVNVHHGIIPSRKAVNLRRLTEKQIAIYLTISLRYVAQFMRDYEYDSQQVVLRTLNGKVSAGVRATKVVELGWKEAERVVSGRDDSEDPVVEIKEGEIVKVVGSEVVEGKTKKPALMSEAKLVEAMENPSQYVTDPDARALLAEGDGIGTSATRSDTIDRAIKKNLIKKSGKGLESTRLFDQHVSKFKNMDAGLTAILQRAVKAASEGRVDEQSVIVQHQNFVTKMMSDWAL